MWVLAYDSMENCGGTDRFNRKRYGWMQRIKEERVLVSISGILIPYNYLYLFIYVGKDFVLIVETCLHLIDLSS
jgi:hypothetical protein